MVEKTIGTAAWKPRADCRPLRELGRWRGIQRAMAEEIQSWEQTDLLALAQPPDPPPQAALVELSPPLQAPSEEAVSPEGSLQETIAADQERSPAPIATPVSLPGFSKTSTRPSPRLHRLLILDTETTALQPEQGDCIEVGAVLFHVPGRAVLTQVSFLLPCDSNGAEAINGIPAAISQLEQPWQDALNLLLAMVAAADGILAHNAAFDRQWFGHGALPALNKPWICSMEDIPWPAERHLKPNPSVRDLALAYEVPVWAAHRALTDCTYLAQVLQRCDNLEALLQAAQEPRQLYRAQLGYSERHQAKAAGFRWNDPIPGAWTKRLSEREVITLPFRVNPVLSA